MKTEESSKKNKKRASNRSIVTESEFGIDRDQKSEIQFIDFTDESNRKTNRVSYSKIVYFRDAMVILIINKVFSNQSEFRKLSSKNVAAVCFLYFLMSNSKKKENNKTAITILNSIKNSFIERNVRYFQIWLDRFCHDFFQSEENRNLIFKIYTSKVSKSKTISSKSKEAEKKKFDKTFEFDQFNQLIKKFRNENLVYKILIVHIIEHLIQNQREQFYRIEKLKRKFDDLSRKMKNYFRKSTELLNDRITATNRNRNRDRDHDHIKNRDRTRNRDHSKNRYKINKHHNINSSSFSFRSRHRHRNRNEKHDRKRKFYYKSSFESDSEENIRIVFKKRKRMFIVNKKIFSVHKKFSKMNRNRKRKRFRNRKNFRKKKDFRDRYKVNKHHNANASSDRSRSKNRNRYRFKNQIFRFRTTKIMNFDFAETSVAFFIRRFKHITKIKKKTVLRILFMCLKKSAMKWHNSFFFKIRNEMNRNLIVWKNELFKKYRFNEFDFFEEVKELKFRFDENLIFSQYLFRKINLLHDDDIFEEHTIIQFIWNEFDAHLSMTISVKKSDDTLKSFERRVRENY